MRPENGAKTRNLVVLLETQCSNGEQRSHGQRRYGNKHYPMSFLLRVIALTIASAIAAESSQNRPLSGISMNPGVYVLMYTRVFRVLILAIVSTFRAVLYRRNETNVSILYGLYMRAFHFIQTQTKRLKTKPCIGRYCPEFNQSIVLI